MELEPRNTETREDSQLLASFLRRPHTTRWPQRCVSLARGSICFFTEKRWDDRKCLFADCIFYLDSDFFFLRNSPSSLIALFHTLAFSSRPVSPPCASTIKGIRAPALTLSIRPSGFALNAVFCCLAPVRPACRRLWPWTTQCSSRSVKCCVNGTRCENYH